MSIERSIPELEAWYAQYDDISYRRESPDAYHHELVRTAEALRDDGAIDWDDWLALKALAGAGAAGHCLLAGTKGGRPAVSSPGHRSGRLWLPLPGATLLERCGDPGAR